MGCLKENLLIDKNQLLNLVEAAEGKSITFHRAIDVTNKEELGENLKILSDCGVSTILTSGFEASVTKEVLKFNSFKMLTPQFHTPVSSTQGPFFFSLRNPSEFTNLC